MTDVPHGLIFYPDSEPGIQRRRQGRGFSYLAPDGTRIDCARERKRLAALAIPPAYEDVWITPHDNGHLLATGRDARARKQYRYHPDWRAVREAQKFDGLAAFGQALPRIRRRIRADLNGEVGDRDYAIAAILAILDRLAIRVGHDAYTAANGSYGATTLRSEHLRYDDDGMRLRYRAKGGKRVTRDLRDRTLARMFEAMQDLPGGKLITWTDDAGRPHDVTSEMVNARLSDLVDAPEVSAKTFRTWAGSEAALAVVLRPEQPTIKALSEAAAERLANTPTIARNSYIHPAIIDLVDAPVSTRLALLDNLPDVDGLRQSEEALLRLIT